MNQIQETYARETIKQQCKALQERGFKTRITFNQDQLTPCLVTIVTGNKIYRFADPDINIIISQLCKLHETLREKKWKIH